MRAVHAPLPGRGVLLVGLTGTLAVASVDLFLSGRLTMFFDLSFITLCLWVGRLPARDRAGARVLNVAWQRQRAQQG